MIFCNLLPREKPALFTPFYESGIACKIFVHGVPLKIGIDQQLQISVEHYVYDYSLHFLYGTWFPVHVLDVPFSIYMSSSDINFWRLSKVYYNHDYIISHIQTY